MLERISEIGVENRFKENKKKNTKYYIKNSYDSHKDAEQDSLSLSPAFKIASHFRLRIKEVLQESTDKFKVCFVLNEFEFEIKIDLNKLFDDQKVSLLGSTKVKDSNGKNLVSFWASFRLNKVASSNEITLSTKFISQLIERIKEASIGNDLHIYNETSLVMLVDDFEPELTEELFNLCSISIKLIEKLFEKNISDKFVIRDENERFFTLQLVKQNKLQ